MKIVHTFSPRQAFAPARGQGHTAVLGKDRPVIRFLTMFTPIKSLVTLRLTYNAPS